MSSMAVATPSSESHVDGIDDKSDTRSSHSNPASPVANNERISSPSSVIRSVSPPKPILTSSLRRASTESMISPKLPNTPLSQKQIRQHIVDINRNPLLSPKEKTRAIQDAMQHNWNESERVRRLSQDSNSSKLIAIAEAASNSKASTSVSFHDAENHIMGCKHYQRKVKLVAKCCNKVYTCRLCHDEAEDHTMNRYETEEVICMTCNLRQPFGPECTNCLTKFSRYFCEHCRFFDNHSEKDIYHCPHCNICRIGKGLGIDYFHCMKCNACMSITLKDHKCVERSLESDCPICHTYMFTSTSPVMFLNCGHCMHVSCYDAYTKTNYVCPICSKSLGNMDAYFGRIDRLLEQERMPETYKTMKSKIFCCDCETKSTASFHFVYHKCQQIGCGSYNTKVLETFRLSEVPSSRENNRSLISRSRSLGASALRISTTRRRNNNNNNNNNNVNDVNNSHNTDSTASNSHNTFSLPASPMSPSRRILNAVRNGVAAATSNAARAVRHRFASTGGASSVPVSPVRRGTRRRAGRSRRGSGSSTSSSANNNNYINDDNHLIIEAAPVSSSSIYSDSVGGEVANVSSTPSVFSFSNEDMQRMIDEGVTPLNTNTTTNTTSSSSRFGSNLGSGVERDMWVEDMDEETMES